MRLEPRRESAAVDAALAAWRRRAANILLAATAITHLPLIVIVLSGHGPPTGTLLNIVSIAAYLTLAAAAILRRVEYRVRVWACLFPTYLLIALLNVALPHGPYAQLGLFTLPVIVLVLLGVRVARFAILANILILVAAPLLRVQPAMARALALDPAEVLGPPQLVWMQAAAKAGFLLALMILLDSLHRFLLDALAAQCRATADLERETLERIATQQRMEDEMSERRRLERELASIGDEERRRLGHELHDGVCQNVAAALLHCHALQRRVDQGSALRPADVSTLTSLLTETINDAHDIAAGLCPLDRSPGALAPALQALIRRIQENTGVRCEFHSAGDVRVPDSSVAQHLYRIAQEALSNAVRHSHATRVVAELRGNGEELSLLIADDGAGLPEGLPAGGMGLHTMAYRAHLIEGSLSVENAPDGGVRVFCRVPRPACGLVAEEVGEGTHGI